MRAIGGYYDGVKIVTDDGVPLTKGQRVMICVLDEDAQAERRKIDLRRYVGKGGRMLDMDAQDHVDGLRDHDRIRHG